MEIKEGEKQKFIVPSVIKFDRLKYYIVDIFWFIAFLVGLGIVYAEGIELSWGEIFVYILYTYAIAFVLTIAKIDIAFVKVSVFFGIILSLLISSLPVNLIPDIKPVMYTFHWGIPLAIIIGGYFILRYTSKTESLRRRFYVFTSVIFSVVYGFVYMQGWYDTLGVVPFLISFLTLIIVLLTYYHIIFNEFNSLIYSVVLYLLVKASIIAFLSAVGNVAEEEISKNGVFLSSDSITVDLSSIFENYTIFNLNTQKGFLLAILIIVSIFLAVKFKGYVNISSQEKKKVSEGIKKIYENFVAFQIQLALKFFSKVLEEIYKLSLFLEAIGSNPKTAKTFGVNPRKYVYIAYGLMMLLSITAVYTYTVSFGNSLGQDTFNDKNLEAIFLAVIAGTEMTGGKVILYRIPLVVFSFYAFTGYLNSQPFIQGSAGAFWLYLIIAGAFLLINIGRKLKWKQEGR